MSEAGACAIFGPGTKIPESAKELIEILNARAAQVQTEGITLPPATGK
ncbi:MAG: hypothetical protein WC003_03685 [Terrimicrobiaceae bacterium]